MVELGNAASTVLSRVPGPGSSPLTEQNTAILLIEPVLSALGWDLFSPASVDRQYRVFDGTFLDYALKIEDRPHLFVEAKRLGSSLDDPKFIAQTVNYANNEGVKYCVLTDGLVYRIYKTNEPVGMADKLMAEADLRDITDDAGRMATLNNLSLLSRASVENGELDTRAELIFLGGRIREGLERLLLSPNAKLLGALEQAMDEKLERGRVDRLLRHFTVVQRSQVPLGREVVHKMTDGGAVESNGGRTQTSGRPAWDVRHHTTGKPRAVVDLFEQLDERVTALPDVRVTYSKQYVNYSAPKRSFMTAELFQTKLKLYFSIPWDEAPKPRPEFMRDVVHIGHFGMGDTEFTLSSPEDLEHALSIARASHDRNHGR